MYCGLPSTTLSNYTLDDMIKPRGSSAVTAYLMEASRTADESQRVIDFCAWKCLHLSSGRATHLEIDILDMLVKFFLSVPRQEPASVLDRGYTTASREAKRKRFCLHWLN